jgi:hypothetical protein
MLRVVSHPEAEEELEAAARWYEARQPGLGDGFLDDFERTLRRILEAPDRWHFVQGKNRKLNFDRFPCAIIYSAENDGLYIKAVMDLRRRPYYWKHRQ